MSGGAARTGIEYKSWGCFDIYLHRKLPASSVLRDVPLQTVRGTRRGHVLAHPLTPEVHPLRLNIYYTGCEHSVPQVSDSPII